MSSISPSGSRMLLSSPAYLPTRFPVMPKANYTTSTKGSAKHIATPSRSISTSLPTRPSDNQTQTRSSNCIPSKASDQPSVTSPVHHNCMSFNELVLPLRTPKRITTIFLPVPHQPHLNTNRPPVHLPRYPLWYGPTLYLRLRHGLILVFFRLLLIPLQYRPSTSNAVVARFAVLNTTNVLLETPDENGKIWPKIREEFSSVIPSVTNPVHHLSDSVSAPVEKGRQKNDNWFTSLSLMWQSSPCT